MYRPSRLMLTNLIIVACAMLVGCSSNPSQAIATQAAQDPAHQSALVSADLNQAAQQVAGSLTDLAEIEKANYQGSTGLPFGNITDPTLNKQISVSWYGPIAPVLQSVAGQIGYQLQVYGKLPQTPVLVNINTTASNTSALDVLRNIDLQAGQAADVALYPDIKVISLRYLGT